MFVARKLKGLDWIRVSVGCRIVGCYQAILGIAEGSLGTTEQW